MDPFNPFLAFSAILALGLSAAPHCPVMCTLAQQGHLPFTCLGRKAAAVLICLLGVPSLLLKCKVYWGCGHRGMFVFLLCNGNFSDLQVQPRFGSHHTK